MMTDGVLDACPGEEKEQDMKAYLESLTVQSPQELADRILHFAAREGGMWDDMTVLAAGIWKQ